MSARKVLRTIGIADATHARNPQDRGPGLGWGWARGPWLTEAPRTATDELIDNDYRLLPANNLCNGLGKGNESVGKKGHLAPCQRGQRWLN